MKLKLRLKKFLFLVSVDIILLSCVAGAIRSFLQRCRVQYPDDILVCIRTDVRPQHTKLQLDNKFSLAFIKLPVGTEGTVVMSNLFPMLIIVLG